MPKISKECEIVKDMIADENKATLEYVTIIDQLGDKNPEFVDDLYEALDDEEKHSKLFKKMGRKFKCNISEEE